MPAVRRTFIFSDKLRERDKVWTCHMILDYPQQQSIAFYHDVIWVRTFFGDVPNVVDGQDTCMVLWWRRWWGVYWLPGTEVRPRPVSPSSRQEVGPSVVLWGEWRQPPGDWQTPCPVIPRPLTRCKLSSQFWPDCHNSASEQLAVGRQKAAEAGSIDLIWRESLERLSWHQFGDGHHQTKVSGLPARGGGGGGGSEGEEEESGVERCDDLQFQT